MDICLYVAEGEIEKRFLNELKQLEYFVPGKFSKFNLMQKRIKVTDNIMSKHYSRIICIIDTDCEELPQLENLKYNLQELITVCGRLEVMVQNKNFEDELIRLMDTDNLLIAFNQKFAGIKELKKFLSQKVIYKNYIDYPKATCKTPWILILISGYILGSSSEILFFSSIVLVVLILMSKIFNILKFNIDIKFIFICLSMFFAIFCFITSYGFKLVAYDRGMLNISITLENLHEFFDIFFHLYILNCSFIWIPFIILSILAFILTKNKQQNLNKIIFPVLVEISIIIVVFSLILCGKTYDETTHDRFWLFHPNIQCLYKILILYPLLIYCDYVYKRLKCKKIFIFILFIINIFICTEVKNIINNIDLNENKNNQIIQYKYQKIMRYYNLQNREAEIPIEFLNNFFELEDENVHKPIELNSQDLIYGDNKASKYGYRLTKDALDNFYKNGGTFSNDELNNPNFSNLLLNNFILGN